MAAGFTGLFGLGVLLWIGYACFVGARAFAHPAVLLTLMALMTLSVLTSIYHSTLESKWGAETDAGRLALLLLLCELSPSAREFMAELATQGRSISRDEAAKLLQAYGEVVDKHIRERFPRD